MARQARLGLVGFHEGPAPLLSTVENVGRKVDVVLEMVGGPTFDASLAALAPFGRPELLVPQMAEVLTMVVAGRPAAAAAR